MKTLNEKIKDIELRKTGKYISSDGLVMCLRCGQPLQHRTLMKGRLKIENIPCKCDVIHQQQELEKRRMDAFPNPLMATYRYGGEMEKFYGENEYLRRYIRKFEKFQKKNIGIYMYSSDSEVQVFHIARLCNAIIDRKGLHKVKLITLPLLMSLQHRDLNVVFKKLATEYDLIAISSFYIPIDEPDARLVFYLIEGLINAGVVLIISADENIADIEPATYFGRKIKTAIAGHCIPIQLSDNNSAINLKDFAEKELWIFKEVEDEEQK